MPNLTAELTEPQRRERLARILAIGLLRLIEAERQEALQREQPPTSQ